MSGIEIGADIFCIRLVLVVACLYLNLNHSMSNISLPLDHQHSSSSLQHLAHSHISISHISLLSLPVSTTIPGLTISEFILWTINLRKHTNFIRLQIFKLT
jgi:hypothetical protein